MGNEYWQVLPLSSQISAENADSSGTYKPQIHTHYLPHLSLSFARHTVSLNTTFLLLSSDYSKSIHLQADRSIEFHTSQGCHYTIRIPRYGRDLKYDERSAEALIPAVGVNENGNGEVYRLNLEVGKYMRSYEVDVGGDDVTSLGAGAIQGGIHAGSVNTAAVATESHNLHAFGTSIGTVELWDPRSKSRVGIMPNPAVSEFMEERQETTALQFDRSGLNLVVGSSTGLIHLYDLRSPVPILKKDQGYGYPIHTLTYLSSSSTSRSQISEPKILSADKRIIKVWDKQDGTPWTSVEPAVNINSVEWCTDSGMLLTANEGRQQHSFFIPQLGPAPRWCSFLDNLVEEMTEDPNDPSAFTKQGVGEIYDNYKFLTEQQLDALNLSHLIGTTTLLRPYMHGFFLEQRLYEEAKLVANPYIWEEERAKRVKEKIDKERESRIRGNKNVTVKVNKRLAEKMLEREEKYERRRAKRVSDKEGDGQPPVQPNLASDKPPSVEKGLMTDPRFARLFQDEDFAIDETSREFQSLNPSTLPDTDGRPRKILTAVEEEDISDAKVSDSESSSSDERDDGKGDESSQKDSGRISSVSYKRSGHKSREPKISITSSSKPHTVGDRSFGSRSMRDSKLKKGLPNSTVVGEREITFAPVKKSKPRISSINNNGSDRRQRDKQRRSASGNVFRSL